MNNTVDVILTGEASINYFSYSVSTAGDVNGDGYSDVLSELTIILQLQAGHIFITAVR